MKQMRLVMTQSHIGSFLLNPKNYKNTMKQFQEMLSSAKPTNFKKYMKNQILKTISEKNIVFIWILCLEYSLCSAQMFHLFIYILSSSNNKKQDWLFLNIYSVKGRSGSSAIINSFCPSEPWRQVLSINLFRSEKLRSRKQQPEVTQEGSGRARNKSRKSDMIGQAISLIQEKEEMIGEMRPC